MAHAHTCYVEKLGPDVEDVFHDVKHLVEDVISDVVEALERDHSRRGLNVSDALRADVARCARAVMRSWRDEVEAHRHRVDEQGRPPEPL